MKAIAFRNRRAAFVSAIMLSGCAMPAFAQDTPAPSASGADDDAEILVTGYRASLESSANAKRDSVGFVDTIFAEDIGKFPDTNIAESLNRVPGVTIVREISGDGLNVAIRGLGTNFTRVLLNNAPIAIASTGRTDSQNTNREVDLDLFPTQLFTQLSVVKSPTASLIEGGAAGVEGEEVERIDVQIDLTQEVVEIVAGNALRKAADVELRVDLARHLGEDLHLRAADAHGARAGLTVEVGDVEGVEVRDVERADAEAGKGEQMAAAHPAHAGDGDALATQGRLLGHGHPADVAGKRFVIIECCTHAFCLCGSIQAIGYH